jgi:hypothetical protein
MGLFVLRIHPNLPKCARVNLLELTTRVNLSSLWYSTTRTSPTIGLIERRQYEYWALIASVLEHKDNVDILAQS